MLLAAFRFYGRISWKLNAVDPSLFPLPEAKDWFLLSPLLYPQLQPPKSEMYYDAIAPGKYFIITSEIVLGTDNAQIIENYKQAEAAKVQAIPLNLPEVIEKVLLRLRHAGGQATMPNAQSLEWCTVREVVSPPAFTMASLPVSKNAMVQGYWWQTAITAEQLLATAMPTADFIPPTHEVLFLDAVAAHRVGDYRRTILYAAISAEVAFGSVIDKAYERVIGAPGDERFRVIALVQAGGSLVSKDPIYEKLRRWPDFNVLINELALYVLRRSLLVENESLYQKAKRLHLTRNKLVHAGVVAEIESADTYALDQDGSMAALETALALFEWLGERSDFPLPKSAFVEIAGADA